MSRVAILSVDLLQQDTKDIREKQPESRDILIGSAIKQLELNNEYIADITITPSQEQGTTILYLVVKVEDIPENREEVTQVRPTTNVPPIPHALVEDDSKFISMFSDSITPESLNMLDYFKFRDLKEVV